MKEGFPKGNDGMILRDDTGFRHPLASLSVFFLLLLVTLLSKDSDS